MLYFHSGGIAADGDTAESGLRKAAFAAERRRYDIRRQDGFNA